MIHITVEKQDGLYRKIVSEGHAEYDDSGKDILCAAVSALLINAANSLDQLTEDAFAVEEGAGDGGYIAIITEEPLTEKGTLLLDSLLLGLHSVQENYGEEFLEIELREKK